MVIKSMLKDQGFLKSPFEKGGFRGISVSYKIPPNPISVRQDYCIKPVNRPLGFRIVVIRPYLSTEYIRYFPLSPSRGEGTLVAQAFQPVPSQA
jgi:hypothetical protein